MLVPLPISSIITKLLFVIDLNICADSLISIRNVDSPLDRLSDAPTRQNILSVIGISALSAGTKEPICESSTIKDISLRYVDLPAIFGPVINENLDLVVENEFGTYLSVLASTTGCLPSFIVNSPLSIIIGLTQLHSLAKWAREE